MITLEVPQPFTTVAHTADTGARVEGATAEETLARLLLAYAQLVGGEAPCPLGVRRRIEVAGGAELAIIAVDALRAVHALCEAEKLVLRRVSVRGMSREEGTRVELELASRRGLDVADALDIKAVTYHAARFEPGGAGFVAQVIFDV